MIRLAFVAAFALSAVVFLADSAIAQDATKDENTEATNDVTKQLQSEIEDLRALVQELKAEAQAARNRAEQAQAVAEKQALEAVKQRQIAEKSRVEAERQQERAEQNARKAAKAEDAAKDRAFAERKRAEKALEDAVRARYTEIKTRAQADEQRKTAVKNFEAARKRVQFIDADPKARRQTDAKRFEAARKRARPISDAELKARPKAEKQRKEDAMRFEAARRSSLLRVEIDGILDENLRERLNSLGRETGWDIFIRERYPEFTKLKKLAKTPGKDSPEHRKVIDEFENSKKRPAQSRERDSGKLPPGVRRIEIRRSGTERDRPEAVREAADILIRLGRLEEAERVLKHAAGDKRIYMELRSRESAARPAPGTLPTGNLLRLIQELREDVRGVRNEVRQLREMIEKSGGRDATSFVPDSALQKRSTATTTRNSQKTTTVRKLGLADQRVSSAALRRVVNSVTTTRDGNRWIVVTIDGENLSIEELNEILGKVTPLKGRLRSVHKIQATPKRTILELTAEYPPPTKR